MSKGVSVRLPSRVAEELGKLAASTERPRSYLIRKAIETYLLDHADYDVALSRLRDKDDAIISGSELRKRLGL